MDVDAKGIRDFVWRLVRFSMSTCYKCVQKHPYVSGSVSVLFLVFMFLPPLFYLLLCSSPVIFCYAISRIFSTIRDSRKHNATKDLDDDVNDDDKSSSAVQTKPSGKPRISSQMSRRRNFRDKNIDFEGSNEDKGLAFASPIEALLVEKQKQHLQEKGRSLSRRLSVIAQHIEDQEEYELFMSRSNNNNLNEEESSKSIEGKKESLENSSIEHTEPEKSTAEVESSEDGEEEEDAQKDRSKAVEWTADDQQNLMDLGDSEVERNKRLESLIAKRRARKLFKMAVEKSLMASASGSSPQVHQIAPIVIAKNNLLNGVDANDVLESLQMPGSAPSILLPPRNPFDLPYDPHEEKPDLTADSQEFQKEVFCRHESFCYPAASFTFEPSNDSTFGPFGAEKSKQKSRLRFNRLRTESNASAHDQLIDKLTRKHEEPLLSRGVSLTDLVELGNKDLKESKHEESENSHGVSTDKSESHLVTDSIKDQSDGPCTLCSSEASELTSRANLPESVENLEPKVGKHPKKLSDRLHNNLTCSILYSISNEKNRIEDRFAVRDRGTCVSPCVSIASDLQVELSEVGSASGDTISPGEIDSPTYEGDVNRDVSGNEELWGAASSHLSGVEKNESRSREISEVSENDIIQVGFSAMKQNLGQDPIASHNRLPLPPNSSCTTRPKTQGKISENVKQIVSEVHRNSNIQSPDALPPSSPDKEMILSMKSMIGEGSCEMLEESSNPPEKPAEKLNDQVVHEKDVMSKVTYESKEHMEDNKNPELVEGGPVKLSKDEGNGDVLKTSEGIDSLKSIQDSKDKDNTTEAKVSDLPKPADTEGGLAAIKDSQGELKKILEDEVSTKLSLPAAVGKEQSHPLPPKSTAGDIKPDTTETVASGNQENVAEPPKLVEDNDSLKAIKDIKSEPNDINKDDIKMDELTNHKIIVQPSKLTDSEIKAPKQETEVKPSEQEPSKPVEAKAKTPTEEPLKATKSEVKVVEQESSKPIESEVKDLKQESSKSIDSEVKAPTQEPTKPAEPKLEAPTQESSKSIESEAKAEMQESSKPMESGIKAPKEESSSIESEAKAQIQESSKPMQFEIKVPTLEPSKATESTLKTPTQESSKLMVPEVKATGKEPSKLTETEAKATNEEPSKPTETEVKATKQEPSRPTESEIKATQDPSKPIESEAKDKKQEPSRTTKSDIKATQEPSKPTEFETKATQEPSKPVESEVKAPKQEPSKPIESGIKNTKQDPTVSEIKAPTEEPSKPIESEVKAPTQEPSKLIESEVKAPTQEPPKPKETEVKEKQEPSKQTEPEVKSPKKEPSKLIEAEANGPKQEPTKAVESEVKGPKQETKTEAV